jgi:hypothetical protein
MRLNTCSRRGTIRRERLENSGKPVGYSGQAALRREQRDMMLESLNSGAKRDDRC